MRGRKKFLSAIQTCGQYLNRESNSLDSTASGADEIGEALQKLASTAENSGMSIEKSASYIATISSVTRESASVIGF